MRNKSWGCAVVGKWSMLGWYNEAVVIPHKDFCSGIVGCASFWEFPNDCSLSNKFLILVAFNVECLKQMGSCYHFSSLFLTPAEVKFGGVGLKVLMLKFSYMLKHLAECFSRAFLAWVYLVLTYVVCLTSYYWNDGFVNVLILMSCCAVAIKNQHQLDHFRINNKKH